MPSTHEPAPPAERPETETPGPSLPVCAWEPRVRTLEFQAGEVTIGSVKLPSLTLSTHFLRLVGGPPEPDLPFDRFPDGTSVVVAGSYPVARALPRVSVTPQAIRYVPSQYRRYYTDLSGTFEAYLAKFSSKSRSTLKKKVRKFAEFSGGEVAWREYRPGALEEFHRLAFPVSETTYQARLLDAGLPGADEFLAELPRYDDVRAYLLFHEERAIAYLFCPVVDGNLLYMYVGYDPDYQQWSPGTVLQYLALEAVFAEGRFRTFDYTEGEGPHKEFFATDSVACADLWYFRKTVRNRLIVGLHDGLRRASAGSVGLLDRLGLKSRLKKLIRRKA